VTVNSKLTQIIQRLDRIERALQRSTASQIVAPCCQPITDPTTGDPIPILPPAPADTLPEIDLACARMYALIKRKVEVWNLLLFDADEYIYAGAVGLFQVLQNRLGQWVAPFMSMAGLARMYLDLFEKVENLFRVEDVNYCTAAREALQLTNVLEVPESVWERVNVLDRPVFRLYWTLTGGVQGYENVDPEPDVALGCCLPDTFRLLPVVRTFTCGQDTYELDVIGDSDPPGAALQVIVNRTGIPHVVRSSIAGFWVRSYEPPGRFGLWGYYNTEVTNDGCAYLRTRDFDMFNLQWRLVTITGSPYIVWRNRVSYEGTYIEVSRTEPDGWNGVDTI
jgi:hypothetical protein